MEHRHLGRSGLKVSEIAYGNWITHGSQVAEEAATACVAAALDEEDSPPAHVEDTLIAGAAARGRPTFAGR